MQRVNKITVQLAFEDALYTSIALLYSHLDTDLVLISPQYQSIVVREEFPEARPYEALAAGGVRSVAPVYMDTVQWTNPVNHVQRFIFLVGFEPRAGVFDLEDVNERLPRGCAIMLVTHDNRILDVAARILMLEGGRITSFIAGLAADSGQILSAFAKLQRKGELTRHVSDMSAKQFLATLDQMMTEFEQFLSVMDLGNEEAVRALLDHILEAVILKIRELLNGDRGTIFLVDHQREVLRSKVAESNGAQPLEIEISIKTGIAGHVARTGETLNIADPYQHPEFNPEVDGRTGYRTKSILCMPIFDRRKRVFAVAQVLNRRGEHPFGLDDEQSFREFAAPLGLILESCVRMARARTEGRSDARAPLV